MRPPGTVPSVPVEKFGRGEVDGHPDLVGPGGLERSQVLPGHNGRGNQQGNRDIETRSQTLADLPRVLHGTIAGQHGHAYSFNLVAPLSYSLYNVLDTVNRPCDPDEALFRKITRPDFG